MRSMRTETQFYASFTDLLALLLVFFIYLTAMNSMTTISTVQQYRPLKQDQFRPVATVPTTKMLNDLILKVQDNVLFSVGSAALSDSAQAALAELAHVVQHQPVRLVIAGHADAQPISRPVIESNWHLSALRAASVANFLTQMGVPKPHVAIAAHGETHPQSSTDYMRNRRVEIRLEAL